MPEEVVTPAESSPAEEPKQAPQETVSVPTSAEDYAEWRMTGKLPEPGRKPSKGEDSATSKPSVDDESESAPASDTGTSVGKRRAEKRIDQVIAEREAFRRRVEELEAKVGKQDAKPPEPSSVPRTAQPHEPLGRKMPVEPNQDDYNTWADYKKAETQYIKQMAQYEAAQIVDQYVRQAAIQAKVDSAKARYGDESESVINGTGHSVFDNEHVHQGVKAAIGRSSVMVDGLYVIGSDSKQMDAFIDLAIKDPLEALREWYEIERLVKAELGLGKNGKAETNGNTPMRDEDGKFISAKPPAKLRHAPAPATELGGNTSPPGDERDRAVASGDVRRFFAEGNRRDLARWKGQS